MPRTEWLRFLRDLSKPRPLLVQHFPRDVWHAFPCEHQDPVYTRNLVPNEVLFECDDPPANTPEGWATQRKELLIFVAFLRSCRIPHVLAYSGNKSFHLHLFFSVPWIRPDDEIGMFAARTTLFGELPSRAGVSLAFDRTNMSWYDLGKRGRMVREFLSAKPDPGALAKTWLHEIPESRPGSYAARFPPRLPDVWDASMLRPEIDAAARKAVEIADRKVTLLSYTPDKDWKALIGAGWVAKPDFWEPGTRYIRGRTAGRAMYTAGLTVEEARSEMKQLEDHVEDKTYDFYRWYEELDGIYRDGDGLTYWFPPEKGKHDGRFAGEFQ